jgi:DNA-directed RNA polymerase subunit B
MAPQAIGAEHPMSKRYHIDMLYHTLMYPQRPLTRTLTSSLVEGDDCAESIYQIFNVAIIPSMGKNEEDAIVVNRASIERGLGASMKYTVIRESEAELASGDKERFMVPPDKDENGRPVIGRRNASYGAVDPKSGLPIRGTKVKPGEVIIGKVLKVRLCGKSAEFTTRLIDKSTVWNGNCDALIDSVACFKRSGTMHVLVRVTEMHFLQTGDKMSSVSAQKGVVADMLSQEDMPFNREGIVPDMLFSPHGITSRMTIGGIREFISNYLALQSGKIFDGTAFRVANITLIDDVARSGACEHSFISGITGKPIGRGFMYLVGYTLQRHQVNSKVHARSSGPRNAITQQPSEGRSHKGGLKLGSMEISCLASTGAAHALRDCMTDFDGKHVTVCTLCGRLAETRCVVCIGREGSKIVTTFIPRITLVLMWELAACGVSMRLIPE